MAHSQMFPRHLQHVKMTSAFPPVTSRDLYTYTGREVGVLLVRVQDTLDLASGAAGGVTPKEPRSPRFMYCRAASHFR